MNGQTLPHIKLRPISGWQALNLAQIWQFRDLLVAFAVRDIKLRYRQTLLGVAWVVLQPLLAAGIFSFVFGKIAKIDVGQTPYFAFSYIGLLAWNVFNATLSKTSGCLVQNSGLISKIFFPRLVLPFSTIISTLVDFMVALAMLVALMFYYKMQPTFAVLTLPFWLVLILMLATGCGLYASALMVSYRDVQYILPVLTQFLLYGSPVSYPASAVPMQYRGFYNLNPLVSLVEGFRWAFLGGNLEWRNVVWSAVLSVIALICGALAFKKMERQFADVI